MMKRLCLLAFLLLLLTTAPVEATNRYIEGLSIHFENWPAVIHPGETFSATVRVTNESENDVEGLLRTYIYGFQQDIKYPPPDFWDVVLLNEDGWLPNEIEIHVDNGESKSYTLELKLRPEIITVSEGGAFVRLRTRLRITENGVSVNLAPPDTKEILLVPKTTPPELLPIKVFMGISVGTLLVISVKNQTTNVRASRRRQKRKKRSLSSKRGSHG